MTPPGETNTDLARWRGALMASLPAGHPVHDPTRVFTYDELEQFETELFDYIDGKRSLSSLDKGDRP